MVKPEKEADATAADLSKDAAASHDEKDKEEKPESKKRKKCLRCKNDYLFFFALLMCSEWGDKS